MCREETAWNSIASRMSTISSQDPVYHVSINQSSVLESGYSFLHHESDFVVRTPFGDVAKMECRNVPKKIVGNWIDFVVPKFGRFLFSMLDRFAQAGRDEMEAECFLSADAWS